MSADQTGTSTSFEVEQKFYVDDLKSIETVLLEMGVELGQAVTQNDTYYAHPARDFAVTDEALRLRVVAERCSLTYKGPKLDASTKTRRELDIALPALAGLIAQLRELLAALSFEEVLEIRKTRRTGHVPWHGREIEVALDDVESLGTFVELECLSDSAGLDASRVKIAALAAKLGLTRNERLSYLELRLRRGDLV
jgi:adenylate cyclase class 2